MGDALRRLFLSLGIALGLAAGQPDPLISARVFQEEGMILINARLEEAFAPGARELIDAGSSVALRFAAEMEAPGRQSLRAEETRSIAFELREKRYVVAWASGAKTTALADGEAARGLASEAAGLRLCSVAELGSGGRIIISASIGILDARGAWHEAPVLWNYAKPRQAFAFASPREVPR